MPGADSLVLMRSARPAAARLAWATAACRGSSSRVINLPPGASARAIQIVLDAPMC